jgi:hypothetical protein
MAALLRTLLMAALAAASAGAQHYADLRDLRSGSIMGNITTGYADQPNCLVHRGTTWICVLTHSGAHEGLGSERVLSTVSSDRGRSWTAPVAVEPGQTRQHAYATIFEARGGAAVYTVYVENVHNITSLDGGHIGRQVRPPKRDAV